MSVHGDWMIAQLGLIAKTHKAALFVYVEKASCLTMELMDDLVKVG